MRKHNSILPISMIALTLSLVLAMPAIAGHPYNKEMFKLNAKNIMAKEMTSGDGVSCSNDFALENNSAKDAEVFIILGGRPFSKVQIPQHDVKMYDLKKNLSIAKLNGKPVSMDDWAFVINSRDNTVPIMIHCTE